MRRFLFIIFVIVMTPIYLILSVTLTIYFSSVLLKNKYIIALNKIAQSILVFKMFYNPSD